MLLITARSGSRTDLDQESSDDVWGCPLYVQRQSTLFARMCSGQTIW